MWIIGNFVKLPVILQKLPTGLVNVRNKAALFTYTGNFAKLPMLLVKVKNFG